MTTPIKPRVFRRTGGRLQDRIQPIVIEFVEAGDEPEADEVEDGGERYSEGLADLQQAERDLVRAARRATRAVAKGISTYDDERRASARAKVDGAVEDFPHNYAKAMSETIRESADLPLDLAEALAPRDYRRRARRNLQRLSRTLRLFRM